MKDQVIEFIRKELLGPDPVPPCTQPDGEEIILSDPPALRYGAGVLFPQGTLTDKSIDPEMRETTGIESESLPADPVTPEPDIEGMERVLGTEEDVRDIADETISLANAFLPSALGVSCLVELPEKEFIVDIDAATYRSEPKRYVTVKGQERTGRQYLRVPFRKSISVPSSELTGSSVRMWQTAVIREDGSRLGLELRLLSRPRPSGPENRVIRLLTVTLVNTMTSASGRSETAKSFFQVGLRLHASDNSPCFIEYPEKEGEALDEEELSMALLYRHRKTYAIGHGCSAAWNETSEGRADAVWSEIIPAHEIKPIVPARFEDLDLRMIDLSDMGSDTGIISLMNALCDRYESWIEQQQSDIDAESFPSGFRDVAERHLEKCRFCLNRMRSGILLLQDDDTVMKAFRLANRAMLMQQIHYSLPLREWTTTRGGSLQIDTVEWPDPENPPAGKGSWYPFQIAFILMNLRSIARPTSDEREIVDLIWFPTGGGKTEAYLGLTAFTIILRRLLNPRNSGTTVLMRYTLRLLTAQQFQRAASLMCALEIIRREMPADLGTAPASIGLWVGMGLTPNRRDDARKALRKLASGTTRENPFIILKCPWCGAQMGPARIGNQTRVIGYEQGGRPITIIFRCRDAACAFGGKNSLPLTVIDEDIYRDPPTLLIGTVDKFAMLPWIPDAKALFGIGKDITPPDLIIQDELHLISGPLGSMVGHYETVIHELCSSTLKEGRIRPKIIASTATISRAPEQCHALYNCGTENVFLFPPQCLRAGDSFFAYEDASAPGRTYVGIHASALPSHVTAQVRVMSSLLQAPLSAQCSIENERDPYWTLICYFNSLRELGHAATLIRADIREHLNAMWLRKGIRKPGGNETDIRRFIRNAIELTSRISTTEIPESLQKLERSYPPGGEELPVDICLATNMISVGVDVPRLGLMAVIGQPKTTSEYIQATSRVGRRYPGLVVTIYNTGKPRDRSHYEHFHSYHSSIYRRVEPSSVTPFAAPVRERALHALLVVLVRYFGNVENRERPQPFPDQDLIEAINGIIRERVTNVDRDEVDLSVSLVRERFDQWRRVLPPRYGNFGPPAREIPLMYPAGSEPLPDWENKSWATPSSMRNVDASCEAQVIARYGDTEGGEIP